MEEYKVKYYNYDIKKYPFVKMVTDLFNVNELNEIHMLSSNKIIDKLFTNENDDTTLYHDKFYKKLNNGWDEFEKVYINFIKEIATEIFHENCIIYQSKPTFRVQLPNNIAVGGNKNDPPERYGWHRDTDVGYDHPPFEKNFIIPLTNSNNDASVYIETYPGSDKFEPAIMKVGEFFQFKGGECIHGNKPNTTNKSRVSLDFRLILKNEYDKSYIKSSKLSSKKFVMGGYYNIMQGL
jgi:hypothetical protein